jgi:outer membrane protein assembly factor BamB
MFRLLLLLLAPFSLLHAEDWPMWRKDAGRTASTPQAFSETNHLLWTRDFPSPKPAFKETRLQFDAGYEPVVAGKHLVMAIPSEDSVIALHTDSGEVLWRSLADGPVRFAPVIEDSLVIFGSDDGIVRAVQLTDGKPVWEKRLVPSQRQVLGNQRMISLWPVRGGAVAKEGKVYLAAGVWPLEGTFVFCLDAKTGETLWVNDQCSYLYGIHPHDTEARGGLAPQGYLLIDGDDLVVPCSTAYPARLDLKTGALKEFELPSAGRLTGGWFAATLADLKDKQGNARGLVFDKAVSAKRHEDKPRAEGKEGVQQSLTAAGRTIPFTRVSSSTHALILADDKAFTTTSEGRLMAYGSTPNATKHWTRRTSPLRGTAVLADTVLKQLTASRGYILVSGTPTTDLLEALIQHSAFQFVLLNNYDGTLRQRFMDAGVYGERLAILRPDVSLPPYFAEAILVLGKDDPGLDGCLRPVSGKVIDSKGNVIRTRSALADSTNYLADWKPSEDPHVRAPLGVLWFDDSLSHFKRSPQPKVVDGVMISSDKDWLDASTRKGKLDYRLLAPKFSDIYTGRLLDEYEAPDLRKQYGTVDETTVQQSQYRPPTQTNDWKPGQPNTGLRTNPLTGEQEPRTFPKSYGCDGGFDYGSIYTFRSGTAAFYDESVESGTIHISGPRSGCTNSIVPAGGILSVPYYFEGCTCSYPLPMALALTSLPETFEQWSVWGEVKGDVLKGKIQRLGINFGAPGDRKTRDGTLWLDYPSIGGPSPEIDIQTVPEKPKTFYRHSLWMKQGQGWPWVAASGLLDVQKITISGLKTGLFTVRMTFAAVDEVERRFKISVQGEPTLANIRPAFFQAETQTVQAKVSDDGRLSLDFTTIQGGTLICGLEMIREGLPVPELTAGEPTRQW